MNTAMNTATNTAMTADMNSSIRGRDGRQRVAYTRRMVEKYLLDNTGGEIKVAENTPARLSSDRSFVIYNVRLNEARTTTIHNLNMSLFDGRNGRTRFGFHGGSEFHVTKRVSDYAEARKRHTMWTAETFNSMADDDHVCVEFNGSDEISYAYCRKTGRFHSFVGRAVVRKDTGHRSDMATIRCPSCSPVVHRRNSATGVVVTDAETIERLSAKLRGMRPDLFVRNATESAATESADVRIPVEGGNDRSDDCFQIMDRLVEMSRKETTDEGRRLFAAAIGSVSQLYMRSLG